MIWIGSLVNLGQSIQGRKGIAYLILFQLGLLEHQGHNALAQESTESNNQKGTNFVRYIVKLTNRFRQSPS